MLRYLCHNEIDKIQWDKTIVQATNNRVYAFSWFLDRVSENWDALVWGNYEFVMPLTWRKKWGIKYIYPPLFCQQLGIFTVPPLSIQTEFSNGVLKQYRYIEMQVNSQMDRNGFGGFTLIPKVNFVLPLIGPYPLLASNYSKDRRKNLSIARKSGISLSIGMNAREYSANKRKALNGSSGDTSFQVLEALIAYTQSVGNGFVLSAYTVHNELCAAAFFVQAGNRLVYLNAFSTHEGRETSAMTAIIDRVIHDYAGTGLMLDFEGSTIPGIAAFMKGFGAHTETYFSLYSNRLPFPLNLLKKRTV